MSRGWGAVADVSVAGAMSDKSGGASVVDERGVEGGGKKGGGGVKRAWEEAERRT